MKNAAAEDSPKKIGNDDRLLWAEETVKAMSRSVAEYAAVVLDRKGQILSWNPGASRMFGHSAENFLGRQFFVCFCAHDDVGHDAHKSDLEAAASSDQNEGEFALTRADGTSFPAFVTLTEIRDSAGKMRGFTCLLHDLTVTREVEAAVRQFDAEGVKYRDTLAKLMRDHTARFREADELFRQLTINIPHAIWIREVAGKTIRYINPAWSKLTGLSAKSGQPIEKIFLSFHPEDMALALRELDMFPNGGVDFDCRILRPDAAILWVRIRTFSIENAEGLVVRVAGIMEDITARRAEEKRLQGLKDEFVATVSHELRTPLTSIVGALGLLNHTVGNFGEAAERLLRIALENSQRLVRLVNAILDIEKIESGNLLFDLSRVRIHTLVEQSIESVRGFSVAQGVQILLDPECAECEVRADPDRLTQVVTNLLANAIKFSPSGTTVSVSVRRATDLIRVSVRDHGEGIPDAFKPRIFEKFAQADNSDVRKTGGTGLGLSIAREIINRLGGEIHFRDAPGGGTIFYFDLPDCTSLDRPAPQTKPIDTIKEQSAA